MPSVRGHEYPDLTGRIVQDQFHGRRLGRQIDGFDHVLETVARYDNPPLHGVTGLREYSRQKSTLCRKKEAVKVLEDIVRRTPARYVFLSYNNEGLMPESEIVETMGRYGTVEVRRKAHSRFRADVDRENRRYKADGVVEFLFCLKKKKR